MDGIVSDVGIIQMPGGKGHIALAIFTNRSTSNKKQRELVIGRVAKAVFDHLTATVQQI